MLARVGAEKARARAKRTGPPADGDFLGRVQEGLELYEELAPLHFSRLLAELGSEEAARARMRTETDQRASEQEEALLRIQARLYANGREQAKA